MNPASSQRLAGKVAIVTGAGRSGNIGEAICRAHLNAGAKGL
jgi:NAD(P)-dependent dehydrogenase (short-subunit alcohol dehydrogenase family)